MNDSCVGANGVAAFVFVILLKVACVGELIPAWPFLVGIPAAARFGAVLGILRFPYARERGLGSAFQDYAPRHARPLSYPCCPFWQSVSFIFIYWPEEFLSLTVHTDR